MRQVWLKLPLVTALILNTVVGYAVINNSAASSITVSNTQVVSAISAYTDNQADELYHNIEVNIPSTIHVVANMGAYIQHTMIELGQLSSDKAFNPDEPAFAKCMQSAIDDKFYQSALDISYKNYLASVSPDELAQDKMFINHPVTVFNNELYHDIFAQLSKSKTLEQNYELSAKLRAQLKEYDEASLPDAISRAYYDNLGEKGPLAVAMGEQILQCIKSSKPVTN